MIQKGTDYRVAESGADYSKCHAFIRDRDMKETRLTYPTIIAERKGEIVGMLGTVYSKHAIIAGPLATNINGNSAIVSMRLIEWYEYVLRKTGVKTYVAALWQHQTPWINILKEMGCEAIGYGDGLVWMKRTL